MSTPEAEKPQGSPDYQRLVDTLTRRKNLKLTEPKIRTILEEAGMSPHDITEATFAEAFRIATQHRGLGPQHSSGKRQGETRQGRPPRASRGSRGTRPSKAKLFLPRDKE
jgi:hypothetical protein